MPHGNQKHGHTTNGITSRTYATWRMMLQRCENSNNDNWKFYGGRDISVCKRWHNFIFFLEDMGERPDGKEIDRIDNDGNYEYGNCQWATHAENLRGRRQWGELPADQQRYTFFKRHDPYWFDDDPAEMTTE